jgi:hypothetical protein
VAWGSRKINRFEVEAKMEDYEYSFYSGAILDRGSILKEYIWNGSLRGMTMCSGTSQLSAIGALLDALREEEERELKEDLEREKRRADIARFGGEVNEELIRKVVRWRKKQEKKRQLEEGWDPDGEWDF